jgi:hypothetical protein
MADADCLIVLKTCYVLLLEYKIVLIGNWHTWLIVELILKGRDRKRVITYPVTWTAVIAGALLYIQGYETMLLKFSVHTHYNEVTKDLLRLLVMRFTVRKCDGI